MSRIDNFSKHYYYFLHNLRGKPQEYEFFINKYPNNTSSSGGIEQEQTKKLKAIIYYNKGTDLAQSRGIMTQARGIKIIVNEGGLKGKYVMFNGKRYKITNEFQETGITFDGKDIFTYDGFEG